MRKRIGLGLVNGTDTTSLAGHSPQCFSMISISADLADDPLIDRGAADSNSGR